MRLSTNRAVIAALATLVAVSPALSQAQPTEPYFRFKVGQVSQPDQTQSSDLAFGNADSLRSGTVGTPVAATYSAKGGSAPYSMELVSAPSGVTLTKLSDNQFSARGTLFPVGSFPSALVRLTDSAGHSATFSIPVTVTDGTTPVEEPLAFLTAQAIPGGIAGTAVSASYSAKGGTAPYSMEVVSGPSGIRMTKVSNTQFTAGGTLSPAGSYPSAAVRLSDSAGHTAMFNIPLTVTARPQTQDQPLSFDYKDTLPSGPVGTPVQSYFTAKGGQPPYRMSLSNAPGGVAFSQAGSIAWAAGGTLDQVGQFPSATVTLVDAAGTEVTQPVPTNVTQQDPLAFASTNDFPATFQTFTQQTADFSVTGGVAPYAWTLSSAPTTVVANGYAGGSGQVNGVVEAPDTYTGVTLTVTDAKGAVVTRTLAPFTVTDNGQPHIDVVDLQPPPATMTVGDNFDGTFKVAGSSDPYHSVGGYVIGGPPGFYSATIRQAGYGFEPVPMQASLYAAAEGTYDMSLMVYDYNDPARMKLVPWGKTVVRKPGAGTFSAISQFQQPVTGTAGSSATLYARFTATDDNVTATYTQADGLSASLYTQGCNGYSPCDPVTGGQDGEAIVAFQFTFPAPGSYGNVRVALADAHGNKVFFDPFDVVSTAPQPFRVVKQFDSPIQVQGSPYGGGVMDRVYAIFSGGTVNASATVDVTSPNMSNLYPQVMDCVDWPNECLRAGAKQGERLVGLSGYVYGSGSFGGNVVTLSDSNLAESLSLSPVTVDISAPPVADCAFKPLASMSGSPNTIKDAVTFSGGKAPFAITASVPGVSFGADAPDMYNGHYIPATLQPGIPTGTVTVTVTDANQTSCTQDVPNTGYALSAGDNLPVTVVTGSTQTYPGRMSYLVEESGINTLTAALNDWAYGPQASAHPDPNVVVLQFNPPGGASVVGYSLYASSTPVPATLYGEYPYPIYPHMQVNQSYLYTLNQQNTGLPHPIPEGDYSYQFNVFLSDGTYRLSDVFTTHVNLNRSQPGS